LPLIRDQEPGKATDARVESAKTEPPRRITRGELPVVMGKLIDHVDDPSLRAALENPANPNEPKGLGTAATRDTILPKLEKSRYVELLKGKDPPIQVTEIGLTFIGAVRRVFPAYGDPVGRAAFEAELAEIGRSTTRDEALRRAEAYQERTRSRVRELIAAIARSETVAVDSAGVPMPTTSTGERPPTKAMVAFATSIAARQGLKLPRGLKSNGAICRSFLDQHAPRRAPGPDEVASQGGPRPPSEAMVRYARSLAEEQGIECPIAATTHFATCRAFLDQHAQKAPQKKVTGRATAGEVCRSEASTGNSGKGKDRPSFRRGSAAANRGIRREVRPQPAGSAQPARKPR
jgi:DNA topoisomerase-3